MTMKELTSALSAGINMLKGFCFDGELCNAWQKIDSSTIQFRKVDGRLTRKVSLEEIDCIGKFEIFDDREGFAKRYPNVVLKKC